MNLKKKMYSLQIKILGLLLVLFAYSCKSGQKKSSRVENLPFYGEASFSPHWFENNSDSLKTFHKIPDFQLLNQNGDTITEETVRDRTFIVDFFFTTCPGICPKMTQNMKILQNEFIKDTNVILLSHSVTPKIDSVHQLANYADKQGVIDGKWHLLTGDREEIYALGRKAYFVEENLGVDKSIDDFLHTENFVLVDKHRHIRGIYNGLNKTSVQQLIADIHLLLKE